MSDLGITLRDESRLEAGVLSFGVFQFESETGSDNFTFVRMRVAGLGETAYEFVFP